MQALRTVLRQGFSKCLLSDRSPAFTSEKFRKFLITHGIQPLLTTSNNPQANGLIERLNATITGKLRLAYLENPKASWTQLVKRVTQTYNNTPHSVTSFPPTYLMFNVVPPDLRTHFNPYPEINTARDVASSRTQNKHKKDKETFDKQHRTPHFEVNDLVLVKNYRHPDTGKLAPYFTGPYTIIEIVSHNVVRIDRPNQPLNRDSDTIHVNKLKYYTENALYITPPQTRFIQDPQRMSPDVYLSEFKHLTPDIFETQLYRIIPPQISQPFLHSNPDLFNSDRFKTNLKSDRLRRRWSCHALLPALDLPKNDHRARAGHLPPSWTRLRHIPTATVMYNTGTHSVTDRTLPKLNELTCALNQHNSMLDDCIEELDKNNLVFSNESRFSLNTDSRRVLIWREAGTRNHPSNIRERDRYSGQGVMVWGGIMLDAHSTLHVFDGGTLTSQRYRDEILDPYVRFFRGGVGTSFIFMDDNARPHRALVVDEYLESEGIQKMEWPARSPDHLVEHVWDALGKNCISFTRTQDHPKTEN
ncbi:hypothetical protein LAZ67_1001055 [Cordylochernes scorpioides]|uniref:Integrase catalytic domain-containing protein n=1 Tax=Cordylochernes scorpioides TaxID=51811 RepID=A0ABY6JWL3_9ARAC|nr:hypothetical protein LAZ67_1001055 [Cordylochernes scorpioides]